MYSEAYIDIQSVYVVQLLCCSDEANFNAIELIYKRERLNVWGHSNVTNTVVTMETHRSDKSVLAFIDILSGTNKSMGLSTVSQQKLKK